MKKKTSIILTISFISLITLVILFFYLSINNSKDCSQLVIDTYELASGIDIPKQTNSQCYYNENEQIRVGIYSVSNIDDFIFTNGLERIDYKENIILWSTDFLLENNAITPINTNNLFLVTGEKKGNKWQCLLDKNTGKMWFEIKWI